MPHLGERRARLSRPVRSVGVERCGARRSRVAEADHSTVPIAGTRICKIGVLRMLMMTISVGWEV